MSPPPPPPPPPPPSASVPKSGSVGGGMGQKSSERSKLLSEIHVGTKLRKTVTNDRSAPMIGANVSSRSNTNKGGFQSQPAAVGGLFANGIPKKPSDNRKNAFMHQNAEDNEPKPPLPSPKRVYSPDNLPRTPKKSPPRIDLPKPNSLTLTSAHSATDGAPQVGSSIAARLEALNQASNSSRPTFAPPPTPPAKMKPALPGGLSVKKSSPPPQFNTINPSRGNGVNIDRIQRSGSSEDIRSHQPTFDKPVLPPYPHNPSVPRISKPAVPPPPPPNISRTPRNHGVGGTLHNSATTNFSNTHSNYGQQIQTFAKIDDDSPPPPPPPRSASCTSDQMDRFLFIPISELPPPEIFSNSKKVYEYPSSQRRNIAPAAPMH